MSAFIVSGLGGVVIVTQDDGTIAAFPGFPTQVSGGAQALAPSLFSETETLHLPSVAATGAAQSLLPALISDADAVYALTTTQFVQLDTETIFAPRLAHLFPTLLANDDAIFAADIDRVHRPQALRRNPIRAAADAVYSDISIFKCNDVLPDTWFDEETLDTYPFKVQAVTGGIPTPEREHLTGSIRPARRVLTGSIAQPRRLTGSLSNKTRRVLTGSIGPRYGGKKR